MIIAHFILYAIPVFVAMSFPKSMHIFFNYTYIGILFCLTQLFDNLYCLQLTSTFFLNGGDIAYSALLFTAIILLISHPEPKVVRVLIYVIVIISLFLFFFFLFISYIMESSNVINYMGIPGEFWSLSYISLLYSFFLFSSEILFQLFLLKKILPRLKRQWTIILVIVGIYYGVLILDGVLFPLGTNILNPGTHFSVEFGILAKIIFGGGFGFCLVVFLVLFPEKLSVFISVDFSFRRYLLPPKKKSLLEKLHKAEQDISELTKILPICAKCKKVRDDTGYWNQVEEYFTTHSDLLFSHGLCPECAKISFAEFDDFAPSNTEETKSTEN